MSGPLGSAPDLDDATRGRLVREYDEARAANDISAMTEAALALAATHQFGTFPGRIPAFLHEAYSLAEGDERARLAVAVARAWAYGGDPSRAVAFASEAVEFAETHDDASLLAAALDAQLLVTWGPDDLAERLRITARLEDAVAHLVDVEARMSSYLWRLTTALECLDATATARQVRALDVLATESGSPRVAFFAAARRAMYSLLAGDTETADAARTEAVETGKAAGETDWYAIDHELGGWIARQTGDVATMATEAVAFEEFAVSRAVPSIGASAAQLWFESGDIDRARRLLHQFAGADFAGLPRDVDWLLSMTSLVDVAVKTETDSLVRIGMPMLEPYAGRGVVNAGGVTFVGVVDDYLARACRRLGRDDDARRWSEQAAAAYQRLGATWWLRQLDLPAPLATGERTAHLYPGADGIWWIGHDGATTTIRDVKGLHYLRLLVQRPGVDVTAQELSEAVGGAGVIEADTGALLDRRALASYRQRLAEIDGDIDEARTWSDPERLERLERERDAILEELRTATGLGGRARHTSGSNERARVAVRKAIAAAIDRVTTVDPSLGRLLHDTVSTGTVCRYDPDPDRPVRWLLTGG